MPVWGDGVLQQVLMLIARGYQRFVILSFARKIDKRDRVSGFGWRTAASFRAHEGTKDFSAGVSTLHLTPVAGQSHTDRSALRWTPESGPN